MKTIGIITNMDKDLELKHTRILAANITRMGGSFRIKSDLAQAVGSGEPCRDDEEVLSGSDILVVLGGDGTFLKAARLAYKRNIPILGINLGNLGFLAEIDRNDIADAVSRLMNGEYTVEERMMLEADIIRNGEKEITDVALNDVVISRGAISRILHVKTLINDTYIDTFPGDGLIVSTPTGSTAYSLSAGGPIVEPGNDLMIITPICPHILYSRSFITSGGSEVKALLDEDFRHNAMVTIDGQEAYDIKGGDRVEIRKSQYTAKLVSIHSRNFFNVLRAKIYNRGENIK